MEEEKQIIENEENVYHKDNAEYTHERDEPKTPPPEDRDQGSDQN